MKLNLYFLYINFSIDINPSVAFNLKEMLSHNDFVPIKVKDIPSDMTEEYNHNKQ